MLRATTFNSVEGLHWTARSIEFRQLGSSKIRGARSHNENTVELQFAFALKRPGDKS